MGDLGPGAPLGNPCDGWKMENGQVLYSSTKQINQTAWMKGAGARCTEEILASTPIAHPCVGLWSSLPHGPPGTPRLKDLGTGEAKVGELFRRFGVSSLLERFNSA